MSCVHVNISSWFSQTARCGFHSFGFAVFCEQGHVWNGRAQLTVVLVASLLGANCDVLIAVSLYTWRSRVGFYRMKLHAIVISFRDVKCYKACLKAVVFGLRALLGAIAIHDSDVSTWLILPVVICLSQRLSHACLSISFHTAKLRMAH